MVEEKEAIERLYNMKNKVDVALMNSKREKGDWLYDDVQGTADTLRMAINALEKQIAKKPIFANNMMTKDKFLMCPCCEFRFPDSLVFLKTRCWNCGQKLDWSDEE